MRHLERAYASGWIKAYRNSREGSWNVASKEDERKLCNGQPYGVIGMFHISTD